MNVLAKLLMALLLAAGGVGAQADGADRCIAPMTYLPLDSATVGADDDGMAALGTYERISPDGRFILRSYSGAKLGQVSLIELPASSTGAIRAHPTAFSNEAFPVQGSWRYLVDINGRHYRFADVLRHGKSAQALFRGGMTGFYAAASELSTTSGDTTTGNERIRIRSLSWPDGNGSDRQGVGPLQIATITVEDNGREARVVSTTGAQFICGQRVSVDGNAFALPMISVAGDEFSAIPQAPRKGQPSMRIYGLSADPGARDHACDLRDDLGFSPSKAVFGFPGEKQPARLVFSDVGYVYVHDRALNETFRLGHGRYGVLASAFPGLTRDGRVIYGATWRDCEKQGACPRQSGYVVIDPYQSTAWRDHWQKRGEPAPKTCITEAEVRHERTRFARTHGLDMD